MKLKLAMPVLVFAALAATVAPASAASRSKTEDAAYCQGKAANSAERDACLSTRAYIAKAEQAQWDASKVEKVPDNLNFKFVLNPDEKKRLIRLAIDQDFAENGLDSGLA